MENLLMEIEKSMHQRRSHSVLNNGGFGYNSFHNYSLNPSINSSISQLLLKNPHTNIMSYTGSLPIISPPHFYSSSLPLNHHHHHNQPPLLPLPTKSSTLPSSKKRKKKKRQQQQQQQQQLKPNQSNIFIPKSETKTDDIGKMAKKEEEEDTEEEFLIVGSLSKTAVTSVYTWMSPPPPSSVPMPRLLLKPKINNAGSCNAEALDSAGAADDLRRLLRL